MFGKYCSVGVIMAGGEHLFNVCNGAYAMAPGAIADVDQHIRGTSQNDLRLHWHR